MAAAAADWSASGADAGTGPTEWAARYEQYLTRAASQSARSLELYQEVMAAVSRGELAPTASQDLLAAFVQARGAPYTAELAELSLRFFAGLVGMATAYTNELVAAVTPGAVQSPPPPPPRLDPADWTRWFELLTEYASQQGGTAMTSFQELLDRVAAGEVPPSHLQQASREYLERRLPEHLTQLVGLCFELLTGLDDVRTGYGEEFLEGMLRTRSAADDPEPFALDLSAPLGATASVSMTIGNTNDTASVIRAAVSDVRRADGVGPARVVDAVVQPNDVELGPGEEVTVLLSVVLSPEHFEAGPLHVGALLVSGHGAERLEVPLRIRALAPDDPSA